MQVERYDRINFAAMSRRGETHVVTLLYVALHYGMPENETSRAPKETPRLSISPGSYFGR